MPSWVLLRMTAGAALLISMCGSALAAAPSQIRGVLRDQGTKSADITVVLVPSTNDGGSARTVKPDDDGGFRFPMVEYGRYRLALEGGRSRIAKLRLQVRNEGRIEEDREVYSTKDTGRMLNMLSEATGGKAYTALNQQTGLLCATRVADRITESGSGSKRRPARETAGRQ